MGSSAASLGSTSATVLSGTVVQNTWLGVIQGIWAFEGHWSLKTWIFRILINRAKTRAVREGRVVPFARFDVEVEAAAAVEPDRLPGWPGEQDILSPESPCDQCGPESPASSFVPTSCGRSPVDSSCSVASNATADAPLVRYGTTSISSPPIDLRTREPGGMQMNTITVKDGTIIYYKVWGPANAQPIVFHHGWPLSADDWDTQMLYFLEKGYRVVAHDRRGHGRSSQVSDGHDMDHYAADAAAVVEHLDLRNAIHIGHSTGGGEATHYVARHGKGRVAKLVLVGAVPTDHGQDTD